MSMGEAWNRISNERVGQVQSQYKAQNDSLEVVSDGALTLKSCDAGAGRTWVNIPAECQRLQKVAIKEAEWIALMQIIKGNLKSADCILIQQMVQARAAGRRIKVKPLKDAARVHEKGGII